MAQDQELDQFGNPVEGDPYRYLPPEYQQPSEEQAGKQKDLSGMGDESFAPTTPAPAPAAGYDRTKFRDTWRSQGAGYGGDVDKFIREHPEFATGVKAHAGNRSGVYDLPGNEAVDMVGDKGGRNTAEWLDPGINADGSVNMPSPAQQGAQAGSSSRYQSQAGDPVYDAIMRLLGRGEKKVTGADVNDMYDPAARAMERAADRSKNAAAERAAFQGTNIGGAGGALDAEHNKIGEQLGQDQGNLMATLMKGEIEARRTDVVNALQFAQGEEKMQLQKQLADLDAQLKREGMTLQNSQFNSQLGQQNQQHYDDFDYNRARDEYLFSQMFGQNMMGA